MSSRIFCTSISLFGKLQKSVIISRGIFEKALTVIGSTVAWDLEGNRDEYNSIDIAPFYVFESSIVLDIPK